MKNLTAISLLFLAGCFSLPQPLDLERGACVVTFPDREDICLEVTLQECFASLGEFNGVGSICESHGSQGESVGPDLREPTPLYLNEKVISAFGGALTVAIGQWAINRRRRKRGIK